MTQHTLQATFSVTSWDEKPFDERPGVAGLTEALVEKTYEGDIDGTSVTKWLMAYEPDKSASFVGLERIVGVVDGRRGSLAVQHVGTFTEGVARAELTVVSGTDQLESARGSGSFTADPAGAVSLTLEG
jgi:hypothetical protein